MVKSILKKVGGSASRSEEERKLCFGDIELYTFPNILGDNPAVSSGGSPLSIDWKHQSMEIVSVEFHEYMREKSHPRRKRKQLVIKGAERDTFLLGLGYKLNDLLKSSEEIAKIRKSREANMKGRFDTFMKVFNLTVNKPKTKPVAVAAKAG